MSNNSISKPKTQAKEAHFSPIEKRGGVTSWELAQMGILGYNSRIMDFAEQGMKSITVMEEVQNQFGATVGERGRFLCCWKGQIITPSAPVNVLDGA